MKDAQKPDHISLNTLIGRIREGRFVIPDFQREFEWKASDIRQLMKSIFLDYYIGSLLLWKGKPENFKALSCEPIYGLEGNGSPEHIVLDGQQRLTAMHYVFFLPQKNLPKRRSRFAKTPGVRNDTKLLCWSVLTISRSTAQLNFHTIVKVTVLPTWTCIYIAFVLADKTVRLIATEKPEL